MKPTIESLKVQLYKLEQRDPVLNQRIISKLKRRIRAAEKAQNKGQE